MNAHVLTIVALSALLASCDEKRASKSPSLSPVVPVSVSEIEELGRQLQKRAGKKIKEMMDAGKPRVVPRGAKPEIVIKDDQIRIDGKLVVMGQSIERWKAVMPGVSRCNGEHGNFACRWDELGITLLLESGEVRQFTIHLNLRPWKEFEHRSADGTLVPARADPRPKHPFRGYFELDGYGIDANTRFWEIRASVDPKRNVRCYLVTGNCGNTTAQFSSDAIIYLELYEATSENGKLADFTVGVIGPAPASVP